MSTKAKQMIDVVNNEDPFFVSRPTFIIGESSTGYILQSSVNYNWDKEDNSGAVWTNAASASIANDQHIVSGVPTNGLTFRLKNNSGSVVIR